MSGFFNSVLVRLGLIFGLLALLTAAAIVVAWSVFQSIVYDMESLTSENLPALQDGAEVVNAADRARTVLAEILIASDADALLTAAQGSAEPIGKMRNLALGLSGEDGVTLNALVDRVQTSLDALVSSRNEEFNRTDDTSAAVEAALTLSAEINGVFKETSESAYQALVASGEGTVNTIGETLRRLIEVDFTIYQAILAVRAEINLMTGIALSLSQTSDRAMRSILSDITTASNNRLQELTAAIDTSAATADLAKVVETARIQILSAQDREAAGISPNEILSIRQTVDAVLSSTLDDIYFDLMIRSEAAKTTNEASVRALLDEQVVAIREKAALSLATKSFFTAAMQVALARDVAELRTKTANLLVSRKDLESLMSLASDEAAQKMSVILRIANPEIGIAATRAAGFQARAAAAQAARDAADAVDQIATASSGIANAMLSKINDTAATLDGEVARAKQYLLQIALISVLSVGMALFLIWLMIARPLRRVTATTERLARGDLSEIVGLRSNAGEIGRMSAALSVFREGALERIRLQQEEKKREAAVLQAERAAEQQRHSDAENMRRVEDERLQHLRQIEADKLTHEAELQHLVDNERKARAEEQASVVTALAESLRKLSSGDLTHMIEAEFPQEYEALRVDYNAAVGNLAQLVGQILQSAATIQESTIDIESASLDLSSRTEKSAATLEETAAAMNELSTSVESASQNVATARTTVTTVQADTAASDRVMRDAVAAMGEIEQSSSRISKVVEVIDSIAFQTNLLALNAGVEAARAGEAGRGFAVVASEVRILARRCSESASEINGLISDASGQVDKGVSLINRASSALDTILTGVTQVAQHMSDIAISANEQSIGIAEINASVNELDRVTQQNAAMFEETTAANQALSFEARTLAQVVRGFNLNTYTGIERRRKRSDAA